MPRAPRIRGDGIHYHVVLRCNNGEYLLQTADDFKQFLALLGKVQKDFSFKLYNYTLMHSHAHLILSTHCGYPIDIVMHDFCLNYSRDFNKRHGRTGHLWKNRYRCRLILNDLHGIACLRYQHRNPDHAKMVETAEEWPWSGYRFYAYGEYNPLLTFHPSYLGLADEDQKRQIIYRQFVELPLSVAECRLFERRNFGYSKRFQAELKKIISPLMQKVSGSI